MTFAAALTAALVVRAGPVRACSYRPFVAATRTEGRMPPCLDARATDEAIPGSAMEHDYDPYRTNLIVRSSCAETVEIRVQDCVGCEGVFVLDPRQDGNPTRVIIDVGIHIDDTLGQHIPVEVEWDRAETTGVFSVVFEMADTHPDEQTGCEGCLCEVTKEQRPPLPALVALLTGFAWHRRTRSRIMRAVDATNVPTPGDRIRALWRRAKESAPLVR
ncbi:MAG: hypothetical protein KUG77_16770 [Nannocystaceae bacterium]|nr:hypothetical protein [Nannocystaceae bacterium]